MMEILKFLDSVTGGMIIFVLVVLVAILTGLRR